MRKYLFAPILLLTAMAFAPAPASAALAAKIDNVSSSIVLAQYNHRDRYDRRRDARPRYRAGHRYRNAPRGWHRYHARPRDWNRRGCIMVGPVWFCP